MPEFSAFDHTLLGVLVCVAAAAAWPRVEQQLTHRRLANEVDAFVQDFLRARDYAQARHIAVEFCASDAAGRDCAAQGDWASGWIARPAAFSAGTDSPSRAGAASPSIPGERLLATRAWSSGDSLVAVAPARLSRLVIGPEGHVEGLPGALVTWVARPASREPGMVRCVRISGLGTPMVDDHESGCR